jgi:hypothetical protein
MLEKKERFLQKKSSAEIEKAKDYTKAKDKNGKQVSWSVWHFAAEYDNFLYTVVKIAEFDLIGYSLIFFQKLCH